MSSAVSMIGPKFYAWDNSTGKPLAFGKVYTYAAGTNTPKPTYRSEDATVVNPNPVILNGAGYADIYLRGRYKIVVKDENDVEVWTSDPVSDASSLLEPWVQETAATQVAPDQFKITGNKTDVFQPGRSIKIDDATIFYGVISTSVYLSGETFVTIDADDALTSDLSRAWVSLVSSDSLTAINKELDRRSVKFTALRAPTSGTFDPENYLETATKVREGIDCYTLGYHAPVFPSKNPFAGGNDYRLFATGGTDDGGSWIDLAGSGLKAQGLFVDGIVGVQQFGAKWDGVTDDHSAIQGSVSFAQNTKPEGGLAVKLPQGTGLTSRPVQSSSDVLIFGQGLTGTYLKATTGGQFLANQAVLQTVDFETVQGTDLWDYYPPYDNGLVMGINARDFTIDGNRAAGVVCGGLYVYGGKWLFNNIATINTGEHGIWTEAGRPGSSTKGDDLEDFLNMHESAGVNIYISNANKHGWFYRGPNDSYVDNIQIKTCGWAGFFQESTGNNSVGNLEIGSIHAYSCACNHDPDGAMIELANANAQFVYVDASKKNGVRTYNSATIIDQILVLGNGSGVGGYWGVITDSTTQINMIRNADTKAKTTSSGGGLLQTNAETIIGQIRHFQNAGTTIAEKAAELNYATTIGDFNAQGQNSSGSAILDVSAPGCDVTLNARGSTIPVIYNVSGRNRINLTATDCANNIVYNTNPANSDVITLATNSRTFSEFKVGKIEASNFRYLANITSPSGSYTPNASAETYTKIEAISSDITINTPSNPKIGVRLIIGLQQNGTGGHAVSFSSVYKLNYDPSGNGPYKRVVFEFVYDGTVWVQLNSAKWI